MIPTDLVWESGAPTENGIYWFDNGLRLSNYRAEREPITLFVQGTNKLIFGAGGRMPLRMIYDESHCPKAAFVRIPEASKWSEMSCIRDSNTHAWIRTKEGFVGYGLFSPTGHGVMADYVRPISDTRHGFHGGAHLRFDEGFQFCPMTLPVKAV